MSAKRDFQNGFTATNGLASIQVHKGVVMTVDRRSSIHDYRDLSELEAGDD